MSISYASKYLFRVPSTTSGVMTHPSPSRPAGPLSSPFRKPAAVSQSRRYCLSKLGCAPPGAYAAAGQ